MSHQEIEGPGLLDKLEKEFAKRPDPGDLGLVMARAGVGKTAFLIQVALDEIERDRDVIHIALGQSLEQVRNRYEALLKSLSASVPAIDFQARLARLNSHRAIQAFREVQVSPYRIQEAIDAFRDNLGLKPRVLLLDGYDWERSKVDERKRLSAFKNLAHSMGACLWMTAKTHRHQKDLRINTIPEPMARYQRFIDTAVVLEPEDDHVLVHMVKNCKHQPEKAVLVLDPQSLREFAGQEKTSTRSTVPQAFTLLSGAASGTESLFGAEAERYGLTERNFTFEGRNVERARGLVLLDSKELKKGAVSKVYLETCMGRVYPQTDEFRKLFQSIWHQVNPAKEVFVVGVIQSGGTVKGGTGWAVELAKKQKKPLWVYDQEREEWYTWSPEHRWNKTPAPLITRSPFTGTGTQSPNPKGREAIEKLFERSFGS